MLPMLNGMFAFAIWDSPRRRLLIARDHFGIKPLYYARLPHGLLFGSELKSLLRHPSFDSTPDPDSLADFFNLSYIPREGSPIRAARKLLPGHYLLADEGSFHIKPWYDLAEQKSPYWSTLNGQKEELEHLFDDSLRLQMRSDVPVASFLSGGLDSSLIATTAARFSQIQVQTYNVTFADTPFDEGPYARMVSESIPSDHRVIHASSLDAIQKLPRLIWHLDEPNGDGAMIGTYLVSELAARDVRVCLSGLGGDELFGGYERYKPKSIGRVRKIFKHVPAFAGALTPLAGRIAPQWASELRLASDPSQDWFEYYKHLLVFDDCVLQNMSFPGHSGAEGIFRDLWARYPGDDTVGRLQFIDQHTYLPDQILALTDRMSMANSLEVRVPFLDFRLAQFAAGIPGVFKETSSNYKIFLKQALGNRLPQEILDRPKWGFGSPIREWLMYPDLQRIVRRLPDLLADWFSPASIRQLTKTPEAVSRRFHRVWCLLVFAIWLRVYRCSTPPIVSLNELLE